MVVGSDPFSLLFLSLSCLLFHVLPCRETVPLNPASTRVWGSAVSSHAGSGRASSPNAFYAIWVKIASGCNNLSNIAQCNIFKKYPICKSVSDRRYFSREKLLYVGASLSPPPGSATASWRQPSRLFVTITSANSTPPKITECAAADVPQLVRVTTRYRDDQGGDAMMNDLEAGRVMLPRDSEKPYVPEEICPIGL